MQLYLTTFNQEHHKFDFASTTYEKLSIILPGKSITIDVRTGQVYDQPDNHHAGNVDAHVSPATLRHTLANGQEEFHSSTFILHDWIRRFLETKRVRWKPKTLAAYTNILKLYLAYVGTDHWPPTSQGVIDWLDQVKQTNTETTVHTYWTHVRTFLNYLEKIGAIGSGQNPVHQIKNLELAPEKPDLPPVSFPAEDLDDLFGYLVIRANEGDIYAIRDLALIRFAYVTGCRETEISQLTLDNLNLQHREATILSETSKGRKKRQVYFDDDVLAALQAWLVIRPVVAGVNEVFVSLGGKLGYGHSMQPRALYDILQRRCKVAAISCRKFHALRHTSALDALDEGISLEKVQKQLGHASIHTTMTYTRGRDEDRARAYRKKSLSAGLPKRADERRNPDY